MTAALTQQIQAHAEVQSLGVNNAGVECYKLDYATIQQRRAAGKLMMAAGFVFSTQKLGIRSVRCWSRKEMRCHE